jgi:hypothetical protein
MKKSELRHLIREEIKKVYLKEGLPPGYAKFLVSLQTLIGDIAPNAWGNKSQITSSSVKRVHNSLKKRYGTDYKKFNDLLKTQKGQFGNWYLNEPVNEGFTKDDWDVKWKLPKDNLFNASKSIDAVNNRSNAIQDLLKLNPKALQAFNNDDEHPAMKMSYNELMRWYYPIMKESVNENVPDDGNVYGWYWPIADQAMEMIKTDSKYSGASLGAVGSGDGVTYITITVDFPSGSEEHFVVNFDENRQATDIESTFISEELEGEGTYRVYMNSDPDEPERINYEIYFGDGTKAEMVQQAKKMAYSKDPTNQYGDPILVKVTHEDDIDDVAWTNVPVNEGITRADFYKQIEKEAFTAGWDSYEENAEFFNFNVEDAWNEFSSQQDAAQEEPKSYAKGGGSDFIDPMGLRESVNEVADPSALELVGALSTIIGGSLGIKFGMDLLAKIVDKALAAAKYNATEILKIVKDNTAPLKAAAQEGKRAFVKKLMSLIGITSTTPTDVPFTIKRNEGTCGYDTDARTGKRFKTPGGL